MNMFLKAKNAGIAAMQKNVIISYTIHLISINNGTKGLGIYR